jgi:hypothetical protein
VKARARTDSGGVGARGLQAAARVQAAAARGRRCGGGAMRAAQGEGDGGDGANHERRWTATVADGDGGGWRRRWRERVCEDGTTADTRKQTGRRAWSREIYDMWTPQFFLSPVDPTLRF